MSVTILHAFLRQSCHHKYHFVVVTAAKMVVAEKEADEKSQVKISHKYTSLLLLISKIIQ